MFMYIHIELMINLRCHVALEKSKKVTVKYSKDHTKLYCHKQQYLSVTSLCFPEKTYIPRPFNRQKLAGYD
jgi:hypothetical protein